MSLNEYSEYVYVLVLVFLAVNIHSQRIIFTDDDDDYDDFTTESPTLQVSPDCNCIQIRRCFILRNRHDWRSAGKTCKYGYGEYRGVCCPTASRPSPTTTSVRILHRRTTKPSSTLSSRSTARVGAIIFPVEDSTVSSSSCRCIQIRRCFILRNRKDWRTAGETCRFGHGEYRGVCCPKSSATTSPRTPINPPVFDTTPSPRTTIKPIVTTTSPRTTIKPIVTTTSPRITRTTTEFINIDTTENEVCGQSFSGVDPEDEESSLTVLEALIVGGRNATKGSWPWMAAIRIRERTGIYTPWCSGFLIDRRHVLSAAHCYEDRNIEDQYRAHIGDINQDEADEYRIQRIVVHHNYTKGMFYNDIAVLTLDREVNFENYNPVCLPDEDVRRLKIVGKGATVTGWGSVRPKGELQIILKELRRLPIVSNQYCQRVLRQNLGSIFRRQFPQGIDNGIICAAFNVTGKDACGGDSGAPLMLQSRNRWYAIGIVSFGTSCGRAGVPGGYTKVSKYMNWIRRMVRD